MNTSPRVIQMAQIIAEQDPMRLIAMGCPEDEYAPEAEMLNTLELLHGHITPQDIVDVFAYWFESVTPFKTSKDANVLELHNLLTVDAPGAD